MARLILKRLVDDRSLLLGVFAGVVLTTTIAAAGPAYLNSLEQLSFRTSVGSIGGQFLGADIFATNVSLAQRTMAAAEEAVARAAERHLSPAYAGHTTYVRSSPLLVGIPGRELPDERSREILLRGYLQSLSGLDEHAALTEGRLNRRSAWRSGRAARFVEAVISRPTAERFGIGAGEHSDAGDGGRGEYEDLGHRYGRYRAGRPRRGVLGRSRGVPRPPRPCSRRRPTA